MYGGPIGTHQRSFGRYHIGFFWRGVDRECGHIQELRNFWVPLIIYLSQERVKLRTSNFVRIFTESIGTKAREKFCEK